MITLTKITFLRLSEKIRKVEEIKQNITGSRKYIYFL